MKRVCSLCKTTVLHFMFGRHKENSSLLELRFLPFLALKPWYLKPERLPSALIMTPGKSCLELGAVVGWSDKTLWRRLHVCFNYWTVKTIERVESLDYKCDWHLTILKIRPRTPPGDSRLWACLWRSRWPVSAFCDWLCLQYMLQFFFFVIYPIHSILLFRNS